MSAEAPYSVTAVTLHWLTAACVAILIGVGLVMTRLSPPHLALKFDLYQIHKSVGVTVLFLAVVRGIARLVQSSAPLPITHKKWERSAARAVHITFYALLLLIPIVGWGVVSVASFNIPTVLFGLLPWPHIPFLREMAGDGDLERLLATTHRVLAYGLIIGIGLHVAAVIKHRIIDRDGTLARMLPRRSTQVLVILVCGLIPLHAKPALAAQWTADPAQSKILFAVRDESARQDVTGTFKKWSSVINFDPNDLEHSSVDVVVEMGSVDAFDEQRNTALPGADWLNIHAFPNAHFTATKFSKLANGSYEALGTLSMKGISRDTKLAFSLSIVDATAQVSGTTTLLRTDFKIGASRGEEWVGYAVKVSFDVTATKQGN